MKKLNGIVIGAGSIGERHINNLKLLGIKNIGVYDIDSKYSTKISKKYNISKFNEIENAIESNPNFALICTFPDSHIKLTKKCIENNIHTFIEKPLSSELKEVKSVLTNADKKHLKIAVGYNLRCEPGLNIIKKKYSNLLQTSLNLVSEFGYNIKNWRQDNSYLNHYILKKGSGVILDSSHEYDFLRWMLSDEVKSVYCQTNKSKKIPTETESIANIILRFKKGHIGNILLDYLQPEYTRKFKIISDNHVLKWKFNIQKNPVENYSSKAETSISLYSLNQKPKIKNLIYDFNNTYKLILKNFLTSILDDQKPICDGWDAYETLKIGLAAIKSSKTNRPVIL